MVNENLNAAGRFSLKRGFSELRHDELGVECCIELCLLQAALLRPNKPVGAGAHGRANEANGRYDSRYTCVYVNNVVVDDQYEL